MFRVYILIVQAPTPCFKGRGTWNVPQKGPLLFGRPRPSKQQSDGALMVSQLLYMFRKLDASFLGASCRAMIEFARSQSNGLVGFCFLLKVVDLLAGLPVVWGFRVSCDFSRSSGCKKSSMASGVEAEKIRSPHMGVS